MNESLKRRTFLTGAAAVAMTGTIRTESVLGDDLFNDHHRDYTLILDNRNAFARQMFSELYCDGEERIGDHAPVERGAYDALRKQVAARITDPETLRLFWQMDEAAYHYAGESFIDGIAFGHVTEEFRQSMLGLHTERASKVTHDEPAAEHTIESTAGCGPHHRGCGYGSNRQGRQRRGRDSLVDEDAIEWRARLVTSAAARQRDHQRQGS